jgi:hypothetical protein
MVAHAAGAFHSMMAALVPDRGVAAMLIALLNLFNLLFSGFLLNRSTGNDAQTERERQRGRERDSLCVYIRMYYVCMRGGAGPNAYVAPVSVLIVVYVWRQTTYTTRVTIVDMGHVHSQPSRICMYACICMQVLCHLSCRGSRTCPISATRSRPWPSTRPAV